MTPFKNIHYHIYSFVSPTHIIFIEIISRNTDNIISPLFTIFWEFGGDNSNVVNIVLLFLSQLFARLLQYYLYFKIHIFVCLFYNIIG